MPSAGTATFTGYLYTDLATTPNPTRLVGDATVQANFALTGGTLSGSATNFYGLDRSGDPSAYTGTIPMTSGAIGAAVPGPSVANDLTLPFGCSLVGNGEVVALEGTLTGKFKGDPISGIRGSDLNPTASVDTLPVTGSVSFSATRP